MDTQQGALWIRGTMKQCSFWSTFFFNRIDCSILFFKLAVVTHDQGYVICTEMTQVAFEQGKWRFSRTQHSRWRSAPSSKKQFTGRKAISAKHNIPFLGTYWIFIWTNLIQSISLARTITQKHDQFHWSSHFSESLKGQFFILCMLQANLQADITFTCAAVVCTISSGNTLLLAIVQIYNIKKVRSSCTYF